MIKTLKNLSPYLMILVILFCSCDDKSLDEISFIKYQDKKVKESLKGFYSETTSDSEFKLYQYYDKDINLIYRLELNLKYDTTIVFNGENIHKLSEKQFTIDERVISVSKYYYDIANQYDEEAFVFVNLSVGLIGINYFPWGLSIFPHGEDIPIELNKLLFDVESKSFYE